jgi:uncharacterized Fe-S cluster protein YjdI/CDGSH-type Zn-finger protein
MGVRDYEGTGIVVHWDADRCQHSAKCVNGAPTVFDTTKRPWISAGALGPDELAAVIDTCPSGALSYTRTDGGAHGRRGHAADEDPTAARRPDDEPATSSVAAAPLAAAGERSAPLTVTPRENGPLVVDGHVGLRAPDGTVEVVERLFLCRCGGSSNKPRCDGTHKRNGFRAPGVPVPVKPG